MQGKFCPVCSEIYAIKINPELKMKPSGAASSTINHSKHTKVLVRERGLIRGPIFDGRKVLYQRLSTHAMHAVSLYFNMLCHFAAAMDCIYNYCLYKLVTRLTIALLRLRPFS